jgi:hypothetical protein
MLLLRQLAQRAVAATLDDPEGNAWTITDIYRLLDVEGSRNAHLARKDRALPVSVSIQTSVLDSCIIAFSQRLNALSQ